MDQYAKGTKSDLTKRNADLTLRANHLILRLICSRGLVPNVVDSPEWSALMNLLNPRYAVATADKFAGNFIPKEANHIRSLQLAELQECENITISFDGSDTRRDIIYFVHATTPNRKTGFFAGHTGTDEHHTVEWVKGKLLQASFCGP